MKRFMTKLHNLKTWHKVTSMILMLMIAVAGLGVIYVQGLMGKIKRTHIDVKKLSCVDVDGYVNIALLGVDSRKMKKKNLKQSNTDCIIVVSMNTKTNDVNLISVYRDTYLRLNGTETYQKINSAFAYGGAAGTIKTLNENMDLNIKNYVLFNFKMVADLVNAVKGIEVDVKDYEIEELNKYTIQTANNVGQKKYKLVKSPGKQTLEGVQAVSYGRIRKGVGDDFKRTSRMRIVIKKVTEKLKTEGVGTLMKLMDKLLPQLQTNLSNNDMIGLAQRLSKFKIKKSRGWPYKVATGYIDQSSFVFPVDLEKNVVKLHKEMFEQQAYKVTERLKNIAARVAGALGSSSNQQTVDPRKTTTGNGYKPRTPSSNTVKGTQNGTTQKTNPQQNTQKNAAGNNKPVQPKPDTGGNTTKPPAGNSGGNGSTGNGGNNGGGNDSGGNSGDLGN